VVVLPLHLESEEVGEDEDGIIAEERIEISAAPALFEQDLFIGVKIEGGLVCCFDDDNAIG